MQLSVGWMEICRPADKQLTREGCAWYALSGPPLPFVLFSSRCQIAWRRLLGGLVLIRGADFNGRLFADLHGAFTHRPASSSHSVVDYFIACPQAAQHAQHLGVPTEFPTATAIATRVGYCLTPDLVPKCTNGWQLPP
jgi:hypothetical protein